MGIDQEMMHTTYPSKNIKRLKSLIIKPINTSTPAAPATGMAITTATAATTTTRKKEGPLQSPTGKSNYNSIKKKKIKNKKNKKNKRKNSLKNINHYHHGGDHHPLSVDTTTRKAKNRASTTTGVAGEGEPIKTKTITTTSKTPTSTIIHHHHHHYHHIIDGNITPPPNAKNEELFGAAEPKVLLENLQQQVYKHAKDTMNIPTKSKKMATGGTQMKKSASQRKLKNMSKPSKKKYTALKTPTTKNQNFAEMEDQFAKVVEQQKIEVMEEILPKKRRKKWKGKRKKSDGPKVSLLHKRRASVTDDIHSIDTFGEPDSVSYNFGYDEDEAGGDDEADSEKEADLVYTPSLASKEKTYFPKDIPETIVESIETTPEDDDDDENNAANLLTNNRNFNEELLRARLRSQSEAQLDIPKIELTKASMVQSSSVENLVNKEDVLEELRKTMYKENDMLASTIAAENHFLNVEKRTHRVNRGHGRTRSNSVDMGGLANVKFTKTIKKVRDSFGRKHLNQYMYVRTIGTGTSSKVKLCRNELDQLFALKIIRKKQSSGFGRSLSPRQKMYTGSGLFETGNEMVDREISILRQLKHPHIIRLSEVISSPTHSKLYLVLEYTTQGPLLNLNEETLRTQANPEIYQDDDADTVTSTWDSLSQSNFYDSEYPSSIHSDVVNYSPSSTYRSSIDLPPIPTELQAEDAVKMHLKQLLMAVDHIHSQGIIHRDIKPENILVDQYNRIKLSDFGVSQRFENENDVISADLNNGTLFFQPPEAFLEGATLFGRTADMWAVGCTMYILLFNHILYYYSLMVEPKLASPVEPIFSQLNFFQKYMAFQKLFANGNTESIIQKNLEHDIENCRRLSPECRDLLVSLLRADPSKRLTAKQALHHIWFQVRSPPLDIPKTAAPDAGTLSVKRNPSNSSLSMTRMNEDSSTSMTILGRHKLGIGHFPSDPTLDDLDTDLESVAPYSSPQTPVQQDEDFVVVEKNHVEGSYRNKKPNLIARLFRGFIALFRRRRRRRRQSSLDEDTISPQL